MATMRTYPLMTMRYIMMAVVVVWLVFDTDFFTVLAVSPGLEILLPLLVGKVHREEVRARRGPDRLVPCTLQQLPRTPTFRLLL